MVFQEMPPSTRWSSTGRHPLTTVVRTSWATRPGWNGRKPRKAQKLMATHRVWLVHVGTFDIIWWLKYIEINWYQLVKDIWISIAWELAPWPWNPPIGSIVAIVFWFGSKRGTKSRVSLEECWWFQWNRVISHQKKRKISQSDINIILT